MRGKVAKILRKLARENSKGMPERQLGVLKTNRTTAVNHPNSTRGMYRMLKKNLHAVKQPKEKANG